MVKRANFLIKKSILALAFLLVMLAGPVLSDSSSIPVAQGTITRDEARITFEWPTRVHFTATASGKTVTITFERPANPDFGPLLSKLYPYITHAERKGDGKTIMLTMDKPYRIRTFSSDTIGGIDLLHIDPQARAALEHNIPDPTQTASAENLAALKPSAGESVPAATTPAAAEPEKPAAPAATPAGAAAPAAPKASDDSHPVPLDQAEAHAQTPHTMKVNVSAATDSAVLRFHFTERVAAAVFIRTGMLWVVFNKPMPLDMSDFDSMPKTVIGKGEVIASHKVMALRVPVQDAIYASVSKEENNFEWAILLTSRKKPLNKALQIDVNTEPPAPPHVFIGALEMADPITLSDPTIGDELVVMPLFNFGEGIANPRDFIEFSLLATAQGVVVNKKADDVSVAQLRNGLRISLPQGATLTPGLPQAQQSAPTEALQSASTLFSYDSWKLATNKFRRLQLRDLFHRIVESKTVQEGNDARLRLAQIYLSEGMAPEAIAMLDGINRVNPVFYRSAKLAAMRGAANFLLYRFSDAARDFSASELNNNKEMDYWRNMLADLEGFPGQYDYIGMNPDYISKYPPLFRQRLAIVAADRSIGSKEYNTAVKIFDTLRSEDKTIDDKTTADDKDNLLAPINTYVNFLMAKISSDTGQEAEATDMWDKLAVDYAHPFVQARAEFSRIVWGMDHGSLTKDEVIDRLERLRLGWHGDSLELQILTLLGDLYSGKKNYVDAMRTWEDGVTSFGGTAAAIEMAHKMESTFVIIFSEGIADNMPTLDALGLYYQYRNYAPPGTTGKDMLDRLADRLIAVDLLDQAASLLDNQMRFQTEKEQRSQIGAKIATIHLLNHQPKKALEVLEDSVYGENAVLLRLLRNRLTAQAMSELGQTDKALQLLGQDDSPDAERIRLDIYWQKRDWARVTASVEAMLKSRKDATAPITLDESQFVLELALAYVFQNDTTQLQYLHDYFGPLMASNPNKPVFDFVTASDITLTPTNFDDVIKNLSDTRSFIENYRARIKTDGLNAIMKPDEKKTAAN